MDTPELLASGASGVEAMEAVVKGWGYAGVAAACVLLWSASATTGEKAPVDRLMASSVCVVGEV
ncbi:MAG: hypothetical protein ABW298_12530, partial [Candidatus Binatia bacterium]